MQNGDIIEGAVILLKEISEVCSDLTGIELLQTFESI